MPGSHGRPHDQHSGRRASPATRHSGLMRAIRPLLAETLVIVGSLLRSPHWAAHESGSVPAAACAVNVAGDRYAAAVVRVAGRGWFGLRLRRWLRLRLWRWRCLWRWLRLRRW